MYKKNHNIPAYILYDKHPFLVFKLFSVGILEKQTREFEFKNNPGCKILHNSQDFHILWILPTEDARGKYFSEDVGFVGCPLYDEQVGVKLPVRI